MDLKNANIDEALRSVLEGSSLTYTIDGKIVTIKKKPKPKAVDNNVVAAELIDVRGKVVGEDGEPLPGASIFVKDSKIATTTNDKGEFILRNVEDKAVILVGYVGYQPEELAVERDLGTIKLVRVTGKLQEVEVTFNTGYERIDRSRSAGSFPSLI
ncbi:carboxypeptidase-like regulatory domain-containing protein [Chitinophaga sedimenti]|nr:carboxypeptidase-like regulatory domain-containing protein [Chitinophaga sedimenti]